MEYMIYTTVDITNTGQYRSEPGKEAARWKEQNFQTLLQTIGIRANISYNKPPEQVQIKGTMLGFETTNIVRAWRFDFYTERDGIFEKNGDTVGCLISDFEGVPYISGLDECMEQNYAVFVTEGPARNIVFQQKQ
jgi:hypothetical protein